MMIRTDRELKDSLVRAIRVSVNKPEACRRVSHVILADFDSVWNRARSFLGDMGMSHTDIDKVRRIIKRRF